MPLEKAIQLYEGGMKLAKFCAGKLEEAEKKVEILTKDKQGNLQKKPFPETQPSSDSSDKSGESGKSEVKVKEKKGNELFCLLLNLSKQNISKSYDKILNPHRNGYYLM